MNKTNVTDIFVHQTSVAISEPIDVQIDELGNNITQVYQFICEINDEKVAGSGSLLNYVYE